MADTEQIEPKEASPLKPIKKRKVIDPIEVLIIKTFLGDNIDYNDQRIRFDILDDIKQIKVMYFNDKYICEIKEVGEGAFGVVLKAIYKGNKY